MRNPREPWNYSRLLYEILSLLWPETAPRTLRCTSDSRGLNNYSTWVLPPTVTVLILVKGLIYPCPAR